MIRVEFEFKQERRIIKCKKNASLKKIFAKYAKKENLNINELLFLNSGINYNTNQDLKKSLEEILSEDDMKEGKILITVDKYDFDRTITAISINNSDDSSEDSSENSSENLLSLFHKEEEIKKYHMLFKLYLILFIKFLFITIIVFLCSYLDINKKYITNKNVIIAMFITANIIIIVISISIFFIPEEYRKSKIMVIFTIIYILCIICNCFLLSKYINYQIIMICL